MAVKIGTSQKPFVVTVAQSSTLQRPSTNTRQVGSKLVISSDDYIARRKTQQEVAGNLSIIHNEAFNLLAEVYEAMFRAYSGSPDKLKMARDYVDRVKRVLSVMAGEARVASRSNGTAEMENKYTVLQQRLDEIKDAYNKRKDFGEYALVNSSFKGTAQNFKGIKPGLGVSQDFIDSYQLNNLTKPEEETPEPPQPEPPPPELPVELQHVQVPNDLNATFEDLKSSAEELVACIKGYGTEQVEAKAVDIGSAEKNKASVMQSVPSVEIITGDINLDGKRIDPALLNSSTIDSTKVYDAFELGEVYGVKISNKVVPCQLQRKKGDTKFALVPIEGELGPIELPFERQDNGTLKINGSDLINAGITELQPTLVTIDNPIVINNPEISVEKPLKMSIALNPQAVMEVTYDSTDAKVEIINPDAKVEIINPDAKDVLIAFQVPAEKLAEIFSKTDDGPLKISLGKLFEASLAHANDLTNLVIYKQLMDAKSEKEGDGEKGIQKVTIIIDGRSQEVKAADEFPIFLEKCCQLSEGIKDEAAPAATTTTDEGSKEKRRQKYFVIRNTPSGFMEMDQTQANLTDQFALGVGARSGRAAMEGYIAKTKGGKISPGGELKYNAGKALKFVGLNDWDLVGGLGVQRPGGGAGPWIPYLSAGLQKGKWTIGGTMDNTRKPEIRFTYQI